MKRDITLEFEYPHPPAKVWRALTDSKLLAAWLMENDFQAILGHEFTFKTKPAPGFNGIIHCKVVAIEPNSYLSYSWSAGGNNTVLTFRLEPTVRGTKLRLEHCGFKGLNGLITSLILGMGWKKKLLRTKLPQLLDQL